MTIRSVMVRVLMETSVSDEEIGQRLRKCLPVSGRCWVATDHPAEEASAELWRRVEADPGGRGPATGLG